MNLISFAYYEMAKWAAERRDDVSPIPQQYMDARERAAFKDGYSTAMNETAQHCNMNRIRRDL